MRGESGGAASVSNAELVDRGARLFEYLAQVQNIGMSRTPDVADLGSVIWLADLPIHRAVRFEEEAAVGDRFLVVGKVRVEPAVPLTDPEVRAWLVSGRIDDPDVEPALRETRPGTEGEVALADHPEIVTRFKVWLARWRPWAAQARRDLVAQRLYRNLYDCYTRLNTSAEATEAVLGLGCLSWKPPGHNAIRRHVLSVPVKIAFDTDSGELSVTADVGPTGLQVELMDFLESSLLSAPGRLREAEQSAREDDIGPFDRDAVGRLVRRLIHCIDPEAMYVDEKAAPPPTSAPTGAYAPALIVRPRGRRGLERVLASIARRIREQRAVPEGIRNLVDPDYVPVRVAADDEGAIVRDGDNSFLPLPLNDIQLRILDHVDTSAHTIVQGPPGTGKTHTAAALITHLLAQGKRVLVTAHTDRALEEVRGKLRDEIKPLCVAVVGTSRDAFADLQASVQRISAMADEHDPARSVRSTDAVRRRIEDLRRRRADIERRLLRAREREVTRYEIAGYKGTLTELVLRHRDDADRLGWVTEFIDAPRVDEPLPIDPDDIERWRALLIDESLRDPEAHAPDLVHVSQLPPAHEVERWFARRSAAIERCREYEHAGRGPSAARIADLAEPTRTELRALVQELDSATAVEPASRDPWVRDALHDIRAGRATEWQMRAEHIARLMRPAEQCAADLGIAEVTIAGDDHGPLVTLAEALLAHIDKNGPIKTQTDGSPKAGLFSRVVRDAAPLFDRVRVDGRIPTTREQLETFRKAAETGRLLNQLDGVWYGIISPPGAGPVSARLAWHRDRQAVIRRVMGFGARLMEAGLKLREYGLSEPDWADSRSVRALLDAFDAIAAWEELRACEAPIGELTSRLAVLREDPRSTVVLDRLHEAVDRGDPAAYRAGLQRMAELHVLRQKFARRSELSARVVRLPRLRDAIAGSPHDPVWVRRAAELPSAWSWAAVGRWLAEGADDDVNDLFRALDEIESGLRDAATELAVIKSWDRAVGPDRLTRTSRGDLQQYVQLVRKLGKGTGIHAARHRHNIQQTLERCRSAVPVWIMPIYRVVEQLDIEQDMFDVVVVDEASQAGLESVFLQYLAPRIVVIGDDKQVSPSGVGIEQAQLHRLSAQYLADDRFRASWEDPKRSLFDEAVMRFPARLTLVEHRRCVPEIIGFSNKIAYEPQGVRLLPVRLYGTDRLTPIETVYVADGVSKADNTNEAEADRIVSQIARCIDDPRYDGKTFGVISLLGPKQAKLIWDKLLARLQPEEIARRQLRCGDAADFQGAERDVVFLSMVKASSADSRLVAQTGDPAVQRYNVAVSRARDQLWLFHSVTVDELRNSEDMRYRLLDYCLSARKPAVEPDGPRPVRVPEDRLVSPFDSLFEQQVFNRIVDRGYRVTPHFDAAGVDIDMVVTGGHARVAIQCDGDHWAGPEQFRRELAGQRDLERCDWPFFRVRQSRFIADPEGALAPLWQLFEDLRLQPIDAEEPRPQEFSETRAESDRAFTTAESPETTVVDGSPSTGTMVDWEGGQDARSAALPSSTRSPSAADHEISPPSTNGSDPGRAPAVLTYRAFAELISDPGTAPLETVVEDLVRIVRVEGPVSAARVHAAYAQGVGSVDRDAVERALRRAVATSALLDEDPLGLDDPARRTYRVPGQPLSTWRTLGVRNMGQMPARELAEIMAHCADRVGWQDRAALMRAVLAEIGQPDLTDSAIAELALVLPLAKSLVAGAPVAS